MPAKKDKIIANESEEETEGEREGKEALEAEGKSVSSSLMLLSSLPPPREPTRVI
jgi:hypothetical protein